MPNGAGPHSAANAKAKMIPSHVSYRDIIGWTLDPDLTKKPLKTVYTTFGHFTQKHDEPWNIGWDSYEGWECLFFGNIDGTRTPAGKSDPREASDRRLTPQQYAQKLTTNFPGRNRFNGLVWDLRRPAEGPGNHLREFWIRRGGRDFDHDQFRHPSRGFFRPLTDDNEKQLLWREIAKFRI